MTDFAAILACIILASLTAFQIALILGAPIGRYAWGGQHNILPAKLRIASAISIVLYGVFAAFIISKAGLIPAIGNTSIVNVAVWILAIYFCIGVPMNAISRSKPERALMTPVAFALAITTLTLALQ